MATRTIDRTGGTVLHTSRTNPMSVRPEELPEHLRDEAGEPGEDGKVDMTAAAARVVEFLGLEALVAIGGDDTLSFARRLHLEGVPVVGIPKTMDNDVYGTDYCIGFSTAVTRSVNLITDLRTPAGSHERIAVVELFGRNSGETSLLAAYLAGADRALISEVPFDADRVADLLAGDKESNPSGYALVTVSEGAYPRGGEVLESGEADAYGHRKLGGIGEWLAGHVKARTGHNVLIQRLAYLMRSGAPDSLDRLVATNYATLAADLIISGETGRLVCLHGGKYATVSLEVVGEGVKQVEVSRYYDEESYRPKVAKVFGLPMFLH
jgi:6-phosphofructokinase 1